MDPIYYLITFICVAGGCITGFMLGRREGIEKCLQFLEAHKNKDNIVKMKFIGNEDIKFLD